MYNRPPSAVFLAVIHNKNNRAVMSRSYLHDTGGTETRIHQ